MMDVNMRGAQIHAFDQNMKSTEKIKIHPFLCNVLYNPRLNVDYTVYELNKRLGNETSEGICQAQITIYLSS